MEIKLVALVINKNKGNNKKILNIVLKPIFEKLS